MFFICQNKPFILNERWYDSRHLLDSIKKKLDLCPKEITF